MSYVNEAGWDRIIRVVLAVALLYLGLTNAITGILGTVALVLGAVFLLTGLVGWCPLYALFKIRTNKVS